MGNGLPCEIELASNVGATLQLLNHPGNVMAKRNEPNVLIVWGDDLGLASLSG